MAEIVKPAPDTDKLPPEERTCGQCVARFRFWWHDLRRPHSSSLVNGFLVKCPSCGTWASIILPKGWPSKDVPVISRGEM